MARGLEIRVLDSVNSSSFAGFGCESFAGLSFIGFTDGDCLWDLSRGRLTDDGKFDGKVFLGRLWMVFLGGTGGESESARTRQQGRLKLDDPRF